ncbi:sugar phosphate isomerase/epimerase family protein [Sphingobacterium bovistauri]|uniref:Sugar phosphate isomerase/epimerase n=1 Tax=Sphingobacterium bovistauri TaxID=2781959 RepID=A0ABS7Z3J0_9SPHI|nr:sugar phosphate isomerase/epimerase family protein [Sphingobacterium bovistauri]MCA5004717.1 sugar phosphate isomerase/epimerase [Sphingobacterium bovistauri]
MESIDRKVFMKQCFLFGIALASPLGSIASVKKSRYRVAVIDLMILKRQKLSAVQLASEIGADGLEVDMGGLGNRDTFDNKFFETEFRENYINHLKKHKIDICSVAMTGFYAQSLATRPTYKKMISDCLKTCQLLGVKNAFLPLGVQCDLVKNPELRPVLVERLREIGKMAKGAGVVVGIETSLDAKGELNLLKEIGSKNIKIYFNFSNPLKNGIPLIQELKTLGAKNISMIHCTDEDGVWLEHNSRLNLNSVKETLDQMKWSGWLVIERSRDAKLSSRMVLENYGANTRYVKSIFQENGN